MRNSGWLLVIAAALCIASCSKSPDFKGEWKNGDNSTLSITGDSSAVMGQEGLEGAAKGTYRTNGDTLWVKSVLDTSMGFEIYNVFAFVWRNDSLYLASISLHRGGDVQTLNGLEFAQRLGKTPEQMAFVRKGTRK